MIITKGNLFVFQKYTKTFICLSNIKTIFQIRKFLFLL